MKNRHELLIIVILLCVGIVSCTLLFTPDPIIKTQGLVLDIASNRLIQISSTEAVELQEYAWDRTKEYYYQAIPDAPRYILDIIFSFEQDPELLDIVFNLIQKESNFLPWATGVNRNTEGVVVSTDRGLFQLNDSVYSRVEIGKLYHIETNIELGLRHVKQALSNNENNVRLALYAYNAGQSRIHSPPESTKVYASEILQNTILMRYERIRWVESAIREYTLSM